MGALKQPPQGSVFVSGAGLEMKKTKSQEGLRDGREVMTQGRARQTGTLEGGLEPHCLQGFTCNDAGEQVGVVVREWPEVSRKLKGVQEYWRRAQRLSQEIMTRSLYMDLLSINMAATSLPPPKSCTKFFLRTMLTKNYEDAGKCSSQLN